MKWVASWATRETLRKLTSLFLTYFQEEGQDHLVFFHNSFRLFLIEKTRRPLLGQNEEQLDQEYHRELAEYYKQSLEPWQWEELFHWYSSGNYNTVIERATFEWFGKQVEALRPIDAVKTDVRLALKAAGHCKNVIALIKLTLIGSGLDQRERALEESELPELLIELGELTQGVECLRDGNRLRLHVNAEERSLQLSIRLLETGLEREGERIFELAEPLELLAGQPITEGVSPSYNNVLEDFVCL